MSKLPLEADGLAEVQEDGKAGGLSAVQEKGQAGGLSTVQEKGQTDGLGQPGHPVLADKTTSNQQAELSPKKRRPGRPHKKRSLDHFRFVPPTFTQKEPGQQALGNANFLKDRTI